LCGGIDIPLCQPLIARTQLSIIVDVNIESADSVIACLFLFSFFSAWFALNLASSLIPRLGHLWELLAHCALEIGRVGISHF